MVRFRMALCGAVLASSFGGCAVDPSGLPGDVGTLDLGVRDLGSGDARPPDDCGSIAETCNGADDDCDGTIDEEVTVGMRCDGDGDGCRDGRVACIGGTPTCRSDGSEAAGEPCDGPDADAAAEGTYVCTDDLLSCPDDCASSAETCNRRDDDCDGQIDEEGVCSDAADTCTAVIHDASVYLFCTEAAGAGDPWSEAVGECGRGGYDLVQIDDEAERAFLGTRLSGGAWWVGAATDRVDAGGRQDTSTWSWRPSGAAVDPSLWAGSEPSGDGSCAEISAVLGQRLNDIDCGVPHNYICEAPIAP